VVLYKVFPRQDKADNSIIIAGAFAIILAFLPETQPTVVIAKASLGDALADKIRARKQGLAVAREIYFVASTALKILFTEPIVAFLGIFNGFAYGLLFLYLDVSPLETALRKGSF
jgi:hypothetical protein